MSKKGRKVAYTDPVTGDVHWVEKDRLIGQNDHSLKGTPKGPMAAKTKKKLSSALKKSHEEDPRAHSTKTKKLIGDALAGRTVSDATRQKLSERAKEQWQRRKNAGHTVSAETKKRLSTAGKGKPKSPEHRAKIAAAMKARKK